ncbi:MAG: ABC transporter transmembrane domain-containing protein [Hyphomicrobium sp.]
MLPSVLDGVRRVVLARLVANGLIQSVTGIGMALTVGRVLEGSTSNSVQGRDLAILAAGAVAFVMLRALQRRDAEALGLSYIHALRLAVFRHACRLPMEAGGPSLGPLIARLTNDLLSVKNWVSYGIAGLTVAVTTVTSALCFLGWQQSRLAIASLAGIIIAALAAAATLPALDRAVRAARSTRGRLASRIGEKLLGRHAIEALGRTDKETSKLAIVSNDLTELLVRRGLLSGVLRAAPEAALPIAVALLGLGALTGVMPPVGGSGGQGLIAWVFVMGLVMAQLLEAARSWDYWLNFRPAIQRVRAILELPALVAADDARPLSQAPEALQIERSSLVAPAGSVRLPPIVRRGEIAWVTGGTAAARSTVLRSLARMAHPIGLEILIDGQPIERVALSDLRSRVALVSPDLPLFRGTIAGNLKKAKSNDFDLDLEKEMLRSLGLADEESEIDALLATPVGEGGRGLHPELAARVRLLRALIRGPAFLLLDEDRIASNPVLMECLADIAGRRRIGVVVSAADSAVIEKYSKRLQPNSLHP